MGKKLYYVCDNTDNPDGEVKDFYAPLFEDYKTEHQCLQLDIYGVWDLMSLFSYCGERTYYELHIENIEEFLIKAVNVEVKRDDFFIFYKYFFEDGSLYEGEIEVDCDLEDEDIESLIEVAKEAVPHVFFLKCKLTSDMMDFYTEQWG